MEDAPDSVSTKVSDGRKAPGCDIILDDGSDILIILPWPHEFHRQEPGIVRCLQEASGVVVDVDVNVVWFVWILISWDDEHFRAIAVISVDVTCDVEVDDVALFEFAIVWDAVADDFVDGCAAGFREAVVIEGGRVGAALETFFMNNDIDFISGDTRLNSTTCGI